MKKSIVIGSITIAIAVGASLGTYTVYDRYFKTIEVNAISCDQGSFELQIGEEAVISAKALPDNATESKDLTYSVSDETIATIDETTGEVKAVGVGECQVIIISEADKSVSATIDFRVAPIPVSEIKIEKQTLEVKEESTVSIEATVNEDATDKTLTFKSSDTAICTVNDKGEVTGNKEGSCTITVSSKDGSIEKTVKITVDDKFGVEECDSYTMYSIGGNLYSGPGTSYDKLGWQGENTEVTVLGKVADSNWYKCKVGDKTGFMGGSQLQDTKVVHQSNNSSGGGNYSYDDSYDYSYDDGGSDYSYSDSGSSSSGGSDYSYSDSGSSSSSSSSGGGSSLLAGLEVENAGIDNYGGSNSGMTEEGYANAFEGITIY